MRPELKIFTIAMDKKLCEKDTLYGDSFKTCDREFLMDKLKDEFKEWEETVDNCLQTATTPLEYDGWMCPVKPAQEGE